MKRNAYKIKSKISIAEVVMPTNEKENKVVETLGTAISEYFQTQGTVATQFAALEELGCIYTQRAITVGSKLDFAKAAAIYNFAINLCKHNTKQYASKQPELLVHMPEISKFESLIRNIENEFLAYLKINPGSNPRPYEGVESYHTQKLENEIVANARSGVAELDELYAGLDEIPETTKTKSIRDSIELAIANATQDIYTDIEKGMKGLVIELIRECQIVLGPVPYNSKYAIVGLGSMARGAMTPYSDLEFAILIEDREQVTIDRFNEIDGGVEEAKGQTRDELIEQRTQKRDELINRARAEQEAVKQYFRDLTHYLHLKIINLGRTILPVVLQLNRETKFLII